MINLRNYTRSIKLGYERYQLFEWFKKKDSGYTVAFIRWDSKKWLEITYHGEAENKTLLFEVYEGYKLVGERSIKLNYDVQTAIYYELDKTTPGRFSRNQIQIF